jgi:hypothetical protein
MTDESLQCFALPLSKQPYVQISENDTPEAYLTAVENAGEGIPSEFF